MFRVLYINVFTLFYHQCNPIGIVDWSPVIELILEKGHTAGL